MTAFVLDDQLAAGIETALRRWTRVVYPRHVAPDQVIKDERVETVLHALRLPAFITIDQGFWNAGFLHPRYCMLYFALRQDEQHDRPALLRRLVAPARIPYTRVAHGNDRQGEPRAGAVLAAP